DVRTFDLPATVGGRFSLWSNAAIACRIVLGPEIIAGIRTGAADMDRHFKHTPIADNLPIRLALLDYWNRNGLARSMRVLLAYARRLRLLPTYLQQLEMESNGKSVSPSGEAASGPTAPALWGGEGSVGQHSYHQWLHQGCDVAPTEFVLAPEPSIDLAGTQALIAHALAQAEVLANGRTADEIRKDEPDLDEAIVQQKVHPGGRPSTMLVAKAFSPEAFGALIALYEHRTFAAGVLWGINSFDQWGVERGKTMAARIKQMLAGSSQSNDPVTQSLIGLLNSTD
ncbi:MAG: glucose-6-phosphate isomerase, partial [Pseudomonadota bacterium]